MAKASRKDGTEVVKAEIGPWKIKQEEKALFARAEDLPNWRLADKARRMLADLNWHFSEKLPETAGLKLSEFKLELAQRSGVISAGAIGVRAASSVMVLLSAGYGPETGASLRRLLEAKLNMEAILDDATGQYAIKYLQGRPRGIAKLAQKYGDAEEITLMSIFAHADVRGLAPLHVDEPKSSTGEVIEGIFSVMPFHRVQEAELLLHSVAYECGLMCAGTANAFGVGFEMPAWVSGQLIEMRDKVKALKEQREARKPPPTKRTGSTKGKKASSTANVSRRKAARRARRPAGRRKPKG